MLTTATYVHGCDNTGVSFFPTKDCDYQMEQCHAGDTATTSNRSLLLKHYVDSLIQMLDQMEYKDNNYSPEKRKCNLHHVYSKTTAHFTQLSRRLGVGTNRMQAFIQTIVRMVVYGYPKLSLQVMSDLCIYYTYTVILDDCKDHPEDTMQDFAADLIKGSEQKHLWWRAVNQHLPSLLKHYGPLCSLNIFRSTLDFFQGCWIEQHEFQGFKGSHNYPEFLRRMNGLGHCVGASLFPKQDFDESKHVPKIVTVIAEMEQWEIHVNDLLSFYKESLDTIDQANLVTNYAHCTGCCITESLSTLTESIITSGKALKTALADKDEGIKEVVEGFMQGYVTWHLTDSRYRIDELVKQVKDMRLDGAGKLTEFWRFATEVGDVAAESWAHPILQ